MKNHVKQFVAILGAAMMTVGMGTSAWAGTGEGTNSDQKNEIAVTEKGITIPKKLESSAGANLTEQTFTLEIANYHAWNLGLDSKGVKEVFGDDLKLASSDNGTADAIIVSGAKESNWLISYPNYEAIGDYWYKLTEKQGWYQTMDDDGNDLETPVVNPIAGMIYGTNDNQTENLTAANNGHDAVYYLHVQVTTPANGTGLEKKATLHKTAPAATLDDKAYNEQAKTAGYDEEKNTTTALGEAKVSEIDNKYYSGNLAVTKKVTGNFGDKNRVYKAKVVFTKPNGQEIDSSITFSARKEATGNPADGQIINEYDASQGTEADTDITWTDDTATVVFYIKDGETVTFENIPYGVTYEVTEPDDEAKGLNYKHTFTTDSAEAEVASFNGLTNLGDSVTNTDWDSANAKGGIADEKDTVTITNEKNLPIDVGLLVKNAPYVALIALAGVVLIVVARRRRNEVEE